MAPDERGIFFRVSDEVYRSIRLRLVDLDVSLKDYFVGLHKEDVESGDSTEKKKSQFEGLSIEEAYELHKKEKKHRAPRPWKDDEKDKN